MSKEPEYRGLTVTRFGPMTDEQIEKSDLYTDAVGRSPLCLELSDGRVLIPAVDDGKFPAEFRYHGEWVRYLRSGMDLPDVEESTIQAVCGLTPQLMDAYGIPLDRDGVNPMLIAFEDGSILYPVNHPPGTEWEYASLSEIGPDGEVMYFEYVPNQSEAEL